MIENDKAIQFYDKYPQPNDEERYTPEEQLKKMRHRMVYFERCLGSESDKPKRILSVGCGTGEEMQALRAIYPMATIQGLEPAPAQCERARKKGFDVYNLPIEKFTPETKYDLIVCSGVLHHTQNPESNLKRIRSWMYPRGRLFLGVYHHGRWECQGGHVPEGDAGWHDLFSNPQERTYSWRGVFELVEQAGLGVVKTGHRVPVPNTVFWSLLYDAVFIWKRQQMAVVLCVLR